MKLGCRQRRGPIVAVIHGEAGLKRLPSNLVGWPACEEMSAAVHADAQNGFGAARSAAVLLQQCHARIMNDALPRLFAECSDA